MKFKTAPMQHQLDLFEQIKDKPYWAVGWTMGTGKSKLMIDVIRYRFLEAQQPLRVLILAPLIGLDTWCREFAKHSNISPTIIVKLRGDRLKKRALLANPNNKIFLLNYESVASLEDLLQSAKFDICIADESHFIKNPKAMCTKSIIRIAEKIQYKYILSGTIIANSPIDIFTQYKFLDNGQTFGKVFSLFKNTWFIDQNLFLKNKLGNKYYPKLVLDPNKEEEFKSRFHSILSVKTKEECLDLPPTVYQLYTLELSDEQKKMYKELRNEAISLIEGFDKVVVAQQASTLITRLHQISNGFYKTNLDKEERFKKNPKLDALKLILEEIAEQHKVIIWAVHRNNIFQLMEELAQYNPLDLFGDTKDRVGNIDKFCNDTRYRVLIANPRVANMNVNLVEADYAIYYSQSFNLAHRTQSEGRNHRKGSEIHSKIMYVDLVMKNTVDEIIYNALKAKENLSNNILGILKSL